ncbi:uncharacterized protein LOC103507816 [Diaphorina citri]|uniref:Uncharacterized protein LOC103507816 n=1 Tax=Diaphorina citri TaxID=121845 RepID=A0A1S3D018_DIACI|nr:uncharacterized protein LOC103507816 [Diaphorina citri]
MGRLQDIRHIMNHPDGGKVLLNHSCKKHFQVLIILILIKLKAILKEKILLIQSKNLLQPPLLNIKVSGIKKTIVMPALKCLIPEAVHHPIILNIKTVLLTNLVQ